MTGISSPVHLSILPDLTIRLLSLISVTKLLKISEPCQSKNTECLCSIIAKIITRELRTENHGGAKRGRTADLLRARQALYQLSYGPFSWWVWADLNRRPHPYQGCALTN
jgi:hypothetical protein